MTDTAEDRLSKISQLVTFTEDDDGNLQIQSIKGDVHGTVWGNINGALVGSINGVMVGTVWGDVDGSIVGTVSGSVSNVQGSVGGNHAASVKERVTQLEAETQDWYSRQVDFFNRDAAGQRETTTGVKRCEHCDLPSPSRNPYCFCHPATS